MLFGGIEAGGTKMVYAIADEHGHLLDRRSIPTKTPAETIPELIHYFCVHKIQSLGIGCFGPIDLNRRSRSYGCLQKTPKPDWANLNILKPFQDALHIPVGLDTDVNGAVLGEITFGAARGCDTAAYMTVGTGIGVGVYSDGQLYHGMVHPEAGHMLVARHQTDQFSGCCSFHKNCLEGLASGPAIQKRWGQSAFALYEHEAVWNLEAFYLGQAVSNLVLCYSPQKIIIGGGVVHKPGLIERVREEVMENLNGYIRHERLECEDYIVLPGCGEDSGILGAIELGKMELLGD